MKVKNTALLLISLPLTTNIGSFSDINMATVQHNNVDNIGIYSTYSDTDNKLCFDFEKYFEYIFIEQQVSFISKQIIALINKTIETNNECDFIKYIEDNKNNPYFLRSISSIFSDPKRLSDQLYFINILLASDIEIFDVWYKMALTIASNSESLSLASRAKDILNYYSEDFSSIDINNALD